MSSNSGNLVNYVEYEKYSRRDLNENTFCFQLLGLIHPSCAVENSMVMETIKDAFTVKSKCCKTLQVKGKHSYIGA